MTGILAVLAAGSGGLDVVTLSATWSGLTDDFGAPAGVANEDRTITWSRGASSRNFSTNYAGEGDLEYRINSGSWVAYTVAFAVTSGQTVGWRYEAIGDESGSIIVTDATQGSSVGTFSYSSTGWP